MSIEEDIERAWSDQMGDYLLVEDYQPRRFNWRLLLVVIANFAAWALIIWFAWWVISIAKADPACGQPNKEALCEQMAEASFGRCWSKTLRFEGTEATPESKARFMFHCGLLAGIWQRRDP